MERRGIRIAIGRTNKYDGKRMEERREGDKCRNELEKVKKKRVRDNNNKGTIFFCEGLNLRMR
jgi:hypothetical protein